MFQTSKNRAVQGKFHDYVISLFKQKTEFHISTLSAKPIRAGHHPSGIPGSGIPTGIRGGGARPPVVKALTEADLMRSSHHQN